MFMKTSPLTPSVVTLSTGIRWLNVQYSRPFTITWTNKIQPYLISLLKALTNLCNCSIISHLISFWFNNHDDIKGSSFDKRASWCHFFPLPTPIPVAVTDHRVRVQTRVEVESNVLLLGLQIYFKAERSCFNF